MPRYDHVYDLAFSVKSDHPRGDDVTPQMLINALQKRIEDLKQGGEIMEACGVPFETYEIEGEEA